MQYRWYNSILLLNVTWQYIATSTINHEGDSSFRVADSSVFVGHHAKQLKKLRNYEVITPLEFGAGHLTNTNSTARIFQITAYGKIYDLILDVDNTPLSNGVIVEYLGKNNSYQRKISKEQECFYSGSITTLYNESLSVVLNYCNGLEGVVESENETIFIEPLISDVRTSPFQRQHIVYRSQDVIVKKMHGDSAIKEPLEAPRPNAARRVRRSNYNSFLSVINRSGRRVRLYYLNSYKREIPFVHLLAQERRGINTFDGTVWLAKDDKTNQEVLVNGKKTFVARANDVNKRVKVIVTKPDKTVWKEPVLNNVVGSEKHIEVLVVADQSVTKFHGKDKIEKYILTMMNIAAMVFKDRTLGVRVSLKVVRIVIVDDNEGGFTIFKTPTRTLVSACKFVSSLQNADESHPDHFDFGVVLTRKDFGPAGYAQLYSMCSKSRSCIIVQDEGLTSAFIVAHETGHLLGLDHDGKGDATKCKLSGFRGSIMAPVVVAQYDRFHWSACSREIIQENIEFFTCLDNKPKNRLKNAYPGEMYTLDEQCQFSFNKQYTKCTALAYNPCQILWCNDPHRSNYCKSRHGPALRYSSCGYKKHCFKGQCVDQNIKSTVFPDDAVQTTQKVIVNGNWGSWQAWSRCSHSCGVGVRTRERSCDSPRPDPGGRPCSGNALKVDICNTERCPVVKSYYTIRNEQCESLSAKDWTLYKDRAFEVRLRQTRYNLNCSFETGFCNWKNKTADNDINWKIHKGATPSYNTGPSDDHTLQNGKGNYIYLEASSTDKHKHYKGDIARLVSVAIMVPRICFTMFYHMFGRDMGKLNVYTLHSNGTEQLLWGKEGNLGSQWHKAEVSFESKVGYKIIVEAVRGKHWASDVAVDDLSVTAGLCPSEQKVSNPCKISCRSRGAQRFKMYINVEDGTRCYNDRRSDICLQGECKTFGCNNKFGSSSVLDDCGICAGNGSMCVKAKGVKRIRPQRNYEVVIGLEKGSTYINLTEGSFTPHYYGIRRRNSRGVYLCTKFEDYYLIDGTTFHFIKGSDGLQQIYGDGPTLNDLDVVVYTYSHQRNKPIAFKYEYFKPSFSTATYQYKSQGYEPCSRTCGTGKQISIVSCIRLQDNEKVDNKFCKHLEKPLYIKSCNLKACKWNYYWKVGKWSSCSTSCDNGSQTRIVRCIRVHDNRVSSIKSCLSSIPPNIRTCRNKACPTKVYWKTNEWTTCTVTCGGGIRTQNATCVDENNKLIINSKQCAIKQTKPVYVEACNMQECDNFIWSIDIEGRCSKSCNGGLKARIVYCRNKKTKLVVDNNYCDGPAPLRIVPCNTQLCPEFVWHITIVTPCSVTCGKGTLERQVTCLNKETGKKASERNCNGKKPERWISCSFPLCDNYKVAYSVWDQCSAYCGIGVQKRNPFCISKRLRKVVSSKYCRNMNFEIKRSCTKFQCAKPDQIRCDFESNGFCNWINIQSDNFEWMLAKRTPSLNTGPLTDHTTNQGYFAYIEVSSPRKIDEIAQLTSPFLDTMKGCLVFWYHMRGSTVGRLRVIISSKYGSSIVFEKRGHKGRDWIQAKVDPNIKLKLGGGYRFIIDASVGPGVYGDIAIDDLIFHKKPCSQISNRATNMKVPVNCREISNYCSHAQRRRYCLESMAYRTLCCKTCASFI